MHATYRQAALALLTISIVGCASKPVEDTSPLVRTAVVKSEVSSTGVKGLFGYEGTYTSSTATDIRRRDDTFKFSGSIMSRIGGKQDRSNIVRLDKGVEWALDNKKKRYSECPLGGCQSDFDGFLSGEYAQEEEENFEEDSSCELTAVNHTFDVRKSGQNRDINGFNADEYVVDWRMSATDNQGKTLENIVAINLWTTPQTPRIDEAIRMQNAFDTKYATARGETYPANVQKALPPEVIDLFTKFLLNSLTEADLAKLKSLMARAADIQGFPVSRKVKWDARNDTCSAPPEPQAEEQSRLNTSSFSGLVKSVGKQIVGQEIDKKMDEKKREIDMAPIMLFVEDVKSIEIGDIRESQLNIPAKYKLVNRR